MSLAVGGASLITFYWLIAILNASPILAYVISTSILITQVKRRAKAIYKFEHGKRIQNIAKTNSKKFWKEIKKFTKRKSKVSDKLTADDFLEHFSNVFQSNDSDNSSSDFGQNCNSTLDSAILQSELKDVISSLKSDKSPGIDGLVAEIFKCSFDIISPLLLKLFNIIFLNGTEFYYNNTLLENVDNFKYLGVKFYKNGLNKFNTLLQSQSKHVLLNLSKFIYFAEERRSLILQLT